MCQYQVSRAGSSLVACIHNERAQEFGVLCAKCVGRLFLLVDCHLLRTVSTRSRFLGAICEDQMNIASKMNNEHHAVTLFNSSVLHTFAQ